MSVVNTPNTSSDSMHSRRCSAVAEVDAARASWYTTGAVVIWIGKFGFTKSMSRQMPTTLVCDGDKDDHDEEQTPQPTLGVDEQWDKLRYILCLEREKPKSMCWIYRSLRP